MKRALHRLLTYITWNGSLSIASASQIVYALGTCSPGCDSKHQTVVYACSQRNCSVILICISKEITQSASAAYSEQYSKLRCVFSSQIYNLYEFNSACRSNGWAMYKSCIVPRLPLCYAYTTYTYMYIYRHIAYDFPRMCNRPFHVKGGTAKTCS